MWPLLNLGGKKDRRENRKQRIREVLGALAHQTRLQRSLLGSTSAMQACQDAEKLEGSHIQVMENMPVSVIAILRAALRRVQSWD